jgi:hypothetical protein
MAAAIVGSATCRDVRELDDGRARLHPQRVRQPRPVLTDDDRRAREQIYLLLE